VITVDKNAASLKAFNELQAQGAITNFCELRQVNYLNNIVDQDHRFSKRCLKAGLGFFSFETPWNTLQGCEVRKRQVHGLEKENITDQVAFIARLLRVAA
jgi:transposase-like protein